MITVEELEKELEDKLNKQEIRDAINKLNSQGEIFKPRRGFVQRMQKFNFSNSNNPLKK